MKKWCLATTSNLSECNECCFFDIKEEALKYIKDQLNLSKKEFHTLENTGFCKTKDIDCFYNTFLAEVSESQIAELKPYSTTPENFNTCGGSEEARDIIEDVFYLYLKDWY